MLKTFSVESNYHKEMSSHWTRAELFSSRELAIYKNEIHTGLILKFDDEHYVWVVGKLYFCIC